MALGAGDIHVINGGTVTFLGQSDGATIHIKSGLLTATTSSVNGEDVIDGTGPGDAGIFFGFAGNRQFSFKLDARYTYGTLNLDEFTKTRANADFAFDTGRSWKGTCIIQHVAKDDNVFTVGDEIPVQIVGVLSGANF
jgi:hypothetical protein